MVPEGWEVSNLGSLMEFKNGLNFKRSDAGESIKIVGVGDFKDRTEITDVQVLDVVNVSSKVRDEELLESGDLLFVRSNGNKDLIGRCLYFPEVDGRLSFSGFTIRGRVVSESVLTEYVADFARSNLMRRQINKSGGGTNISNLSQGILNSIQVLLPPVKEQKRITKILSIWDEAIATTEQLLANSEQQKKALMQQLLTGKKRLPAFEGEKWKKIKVGEMFNSSKEKAGDSPFEVYSVTKSGLVSQEEYFKKSVSSEDKTSYKVVRKGYFVMSGLNFWMGSVDVHVEEKNVIVSPAYKVYQISDGFDVGFVRHFVRSQGFMKVLVGSSLTGASIVRRNFSGTIFNNWPLEMPDKEEQEEIAKVIDCAEREVDLLAADLDRLKEEKKALMQQLLTGKRRVKVDEAEQATT